MNLEPCPCCGGVAEIIAKGDFHQASIFIDHGSETMEWGFYSHRAIQCTNCALTMPELDPNHPAELAAAWNERPRD